MELKLIIKQDISHEIFIVYFEGLPGCMSKGSTLKEAIKCAYEEYSTWKINALHCGFDCFKACLY